MRGYKRKERGARVVKVVINPFGGEMFVGFNLEIMRVLLF